jgi:hypothetical protein
MKEKRIVKTSKRIRAASPLNSVLKAEGRKETIVSATDGGIAADLGSAALLRAAALTWRAGWSLLI